MNTSGEGCGFDAEIFVPSMYPHISVCNIHRQQSEEGEKNGSEDDDDEKPGKRVMGPRKKFLWDDKLRLV